MATSHDMIPTTTLPLFVLGPDFMPMSSTTLRVFEPRYKQMMDDCILESKPFGYISFDPDTEDVGGWTQPATYGVLVEIEDYEEAGSNLMINLISGRRFKSKAVIQPVIDNSVVGMHFPTVDDLMSQASEEGKLYLRCEAEIMQPIIHNHAQQDFEDFTDYVSPLANLIIVSCMQRGQQIDYESRISSSEPDDQELFLWQVAGSLSSSVRVQQQMLSSITTVDLMQVCLESANVIMTAIANSERSS